MDCIEWAMACGGEAVVAAADMTDTVNAAVKAHGLSMVTGAALGRALTAAALLSHDLKNPGDSLTLALAGGGPAGRVVVTTDARANVRGYVEEPRVELPLNAIGKLDVSGAVGSNGTLTVSKDNGAGQPYNGTVRLVSGEIAEDVAYYLAVSEQRPSAVALGVLMDPSGVCLSAGGMKAELLPGASEEAAEELETAFAALSDVSAQLRHAAPRELLQRYFREPRFTETVRPRFLCKCSRRAIARVLTGLGKDEAESVLAERGTVEVRCRFCGRAYAFTREDVEALFSKR